MKKIITVIMTAVLLVGTLSGCSANKKQEINLYTWADYVPQAVIDDFTAQTGIVVNYVYFNDNYEMLSKLKVQKNQYDVIICTDFIIDTMIKEGNLIQKLDKSKLPNFKNIDPAIQGGYYDPKSEYTIPYSVASAILVYDSAKITDKIEGYADLWNPNFKDKIVVLDGDRDVIGFTLMTMGKSINETDPAVLEQARQKLMPLKENIVAFNANTPHDALISGEAEIGYMFGSQATAAFEQIPTLKYVYPKEGQTVAIDNIVLADGAPNKENALIFLNYILDANVAAKLYPIMNYQSTNLAAQELLPKEFLDNKMINIPSEYFNGSQMYQDVGDAKVIYDEIWTDFKSK